MNPLQQAAEQVNKTWRDMGLDALQVRPAAASSKLGLRRESRLSEDECPCCRGEGSRKGAACVDCEGTGLSPDYLAAAKEEAEYEAWLDAQAKTLPTMEEPIEEPADV
jgi:hypothetical protein